MNHIAANLAEVRGRIAAAAERAGRDPNDVTLVVVTKEVGLDSIRLAIDAGARELGENRVQDLVPKAEALAPAPAPPRWHFIGRLQRNKVRAAAPYVTLWQSVDRASLADEIGRRAPGAAVLVQVNLAREEQKGGCAPGEAEALVDHARERGCEVQGLMTIPPVQGDPRPVFDRLRALTDALGLRVCSMGMSGDFEAAVGAGATMVRVGTAIFGPRRSAAGARR